MPGGKSKKKGHRQPSDGRMVSVSGPGGFALRFPVPRLPSWLGAADRLSANAAVYPRVDFDMPIVMSQQSVAAGAIANVLTIDPASLVGGWASRFANTFREYCVVGFRLEITLNATTNAAGLILVFVDETLNTAPNAGSLYTPHMEIPIISNPDGRNQYLDYKPSGSYTDLEWTPTVSTVARQWVKFYANNTWTGTGASTTATLVVRGTMAVAFRGFSNF